MNEKMNSICARLTSEQINDIVNCTRYFINSSCNGKLNERLEYLCYTMLELKDIMKRFSTSFPNPYEQKRDNLFFDVGMLEEEYFGYVLNRKDWKNDVSTTFMLRTAIMKLLELWKHRGDEEYFLYYNRCRDCCEIYKVDIIENDTDTVWEREFLPIFSTAWQNADACEQPMVQEYDWALLLLDGNPHGWIYDTIMADGDISQFMNDIRTDIEQNDGRMYGLSSCIEQDQAYYLPVIKKFRKSDQSEHTFQEFEESTIK